MIQKTRLFIIIIISVLVVGNAYSGTMLYLDHTALTQANKQLKVQQANGDALTFAKLFIDKVLLGEGTINFEDRLSLENSVRNINDPEIFSKWQEFTNSQTDKDSQNAAGNLLKLLFTKISQ